MSTIKISQLPLGTPTPGNVFPFVQDGTTKQSYISGITNSVIIEGTGLNSTIRCGVNNTSTGDYSASLGGRCNTSSGYISTVSGGYGNTASSCYTFIGGGRSNTASGIYSFIAGGVSNNTNNLACSFIVGSNITADMSGSTFVNRLSIKNIPTSSAGLPSGAVWKDTGAGNVLKIV